MYEKLNYIQFVPDKSGNKVIHAYNNVNDMVIWSVIVNHLPTLKSEVELLMGRD